MATWQGCKLHTSECVAAAQHQGITDLYMLSRAEKTCALSSHSRSGMSDCRASQASSREAGRCTWRSTRRRVAGTFSTSAVWESRALASHIGLLCSVHASGSKLDLPEPALHRNCAPRCFRRAPSSTGRCKLCAWRDLQSPEVPARSCRDPGVALHGIGDVRRLGVRTAAAAAWCCLCSLRCNNNASAWSCCALCWVKLSATQSARQAGKHAEWHALNGRH